MTFNLGLSSACLVAASVISQGAYAQTAPPAPQAPQAPKARQAQTFMVQKGGGFLGIGGVEVTAEKAKALNLKDEHGVEVSSVTEDGPAAKAGIKAGDVVLEFNGTPVQGTVQFQRMVSEIPAGRQVKITVWRGGAQQTLTATIGERKVTAMMPAEGGVYRFTMPAMPNMPNMPDMPEMPRMGEMNIPRFETLTPNPALGIYGESLAEADQLAEFFGVSDGVLVRSVRKGSAAEKAGLKAGDVITKVDDARISTSTDITRALRALHGKKSTVNVTVVRSKKEVVLPVTVETPGVTTRASLEVITC